MKTKNTLKNIVLSLSLLSASAGMLNASENAGSFGRNFLNTVWEFAANATNKVGGAINGILKVEIKEINTDTDRLPNEFISKFNLGGYQINSSDGNLKIQKFSLSEEQNRNEFLQQLLSYINNEDNSTRQKEFGEYLQQFQESSGYEAIAFLQLDGSDSRFPDFFKKVFIVQDGNLKFKECKGWRDNDIQDILSDKGKFEKLVQDKKLQFFVYHKQLNSLTEIVYVNRDEEVAQSNILRKSFKALKKIGTSAGVFAGCSLLKSIPVLGWAISPIVSIPQSCAFVCLSYQVYNVLSDSMKEKIKNYISPRAKQLSERCFGKVNTETIIKCKNTILPCIASIFKKQ